MPWTREPAPLVTAPKRTQLNGRGASRTRLPLLRSHTFSANLAMIPCCFQQVMTVLLRVCRRGTHACVALTGAVRVGRRPRAGDKAGVGGPGRLAGRLAGAARWRTIRARHVACAVAETAAARRRAGLAYSRMHAVCAGTHLILRVFELATRIPLLSSDPPPVMDTLTGRRGGALGWICASVCWWWWCVFWGGGVSQRQRDEWRVLVASEGRERSEQGWIRRSSAARGAATGKSPPGLPWRECAGACRWRCTPGVGSGVPRRREGVRARQAAGSI